MIRVQEAMREIWEKVEVLPPVSLSIEECVGLVLARDVVSDMDLPPFDKSAMDGFALSSRDLDEVRACLRMVTTIQAGSIYPERLLRGEAARIMTGAKLPDGADAVVMMEDASEAKGFVELHKKVHHGENVCKRGEDLRRGEVAVKKGTLISPQVLGVLASVGAKDVVVHRPARVSILSTGDEIVEPGEVLPEGKIRNADGPLLVGELKRLGIRASYLGITKDEPGDLEKNIARGLEADLLLLTGGVSMGQTDLVPDVLGRMGGQVFFHKVAMKPGKPTLFARLEKTIVLGLPGNPVSVLCTFHLFGKTAIQKMLGYSRPALPVFSAILEEPCGKKEDRFSFVPALARIERGEWHARPVRWHGSADLTGSAGGNSFICVGEGKGPIPAGERASILLLFPEEVSGELTPMPNRGESP